MDNETLKELYEIDDWDVFWALLIEKIHPNHNKIPKQIKKISKRKYGRRANLERYYIAKYKGLDIGKYTSGYENLISQSSLIESIGAFCSIAENVNFADGNHPLSCVTTSQFLYVNDYGFIADGGVEKLLELEKRNRPSKIGNDVWIGRDVTILPSVTIGDGAVIGTGAVVNRDIPDYAIAVGVPARVIKYRFSEDKIKRIKEIKWWEWSDSKIKKYIELFYDADLFLNKQLV